MYHTLWKLRKFIYMVVKANNNPFLSFFVFSFFHIFFFFCFLIFILSSHSIYIFIPLFGGLVNFSSLIYVQRWLSFPSLTILILLTYAFLKIISLLTLFDYYLEIIDISNSSSKNTKTNHYIQTITTTTTTITTTTTTTTIIIITPAGLQLHSYQGTNPLRPPRAAASTTSLR